jgi:hypothetical protein
MPLPVFFLEFLDAHGRNPRPQEMTVHQRRAMRKCCQQNREAAKRVVGYRQALERIEADPETLHEVISALQKMLMREGAAAVTEQARLALAGSDGDVEHWDRLLRDCVGLSVAPDDG